ncbi:stage 0 sporulation regulatory protein [Evansella caseinilytica]|uniref:Stage 0 sporulation regulatory protein n=1 Tax=Evansella caseinilytica TaxID=1503961 RepID=A0A1H3SI03_9BACI|nr:aspartyl-phosphate phosphatase Spo0E family protein [Evansella caseinilytica]SDZ37602.1 stage 0 sporulation regulatory protein [Evansella caseinilytica]
MTNTISQQELLKEIESARNKMHELSYKMNRTSKEVVEISTYLDQLLNRYQSLAAKNENQQR